jgi:hypothetical protein
MPAIRRATFTEIMWRQYRFVYRASGGRVGGAIGGAPVLLLTSLADRACCAGDVGGMLRGLLRTASWSLFLATQAPPQAR